MIPVVVIIVLILVVYYYYSSSPTPKSVSTVPPPQVITVPATENPTPVVLVQAPAVPAAAVITVPSTVTSTTPVVAIPAVVALDKSALATGQNFMCSSGDPQGYNNYYVYRYMGNDVANLYPNWPIMSKYTSNGPQLKINCTGLTRGPDMT
jgi:hypothetical protein